MLCEPVWRALLGQLCPTGPSFVPILLVSPLPSVLRAFYWPGALATPFFVLPLDCTAFYYTDHNVLLYFYLPISSYQMACILRVREIPFCLNFWSLAVRWAQWLAYRNTHGNLIFNSVGWIKGRKNRGMEGGRCQFSYVRTFVTKVLVFALGIMYIF